MASQGENLLWGMEIQSFSHSGFDLSAEASSAKYDKARTLVFWDCLLSNTFEPGESQRHHEKSRPDGRLVKLGSGGWTRTSDIRINSPVFYQLNYTRSIDLAILTMNNPNFKHFFSQNRIFLKLSPANDPPTLFYYEFWTNPRHPKNDILSKTHLAS